MKRNLSEGWADYPEHFTSPEDVRVYDTLFESDPCERIGWLIQRPLLLSELVRLHHGRADSDGRALDFACGTGRVTHVVRDAGWYVVGLDASEEMIKPAQLRLPDVEFRQGLLGEATTSAWLADHGPFQLVTAFRFFLNAPAGERVPLLGLLVAQLSPDGRVVVNNHGSGPSLRNLGLRIRRKDGSTILSQRAFVKMLRGTGLQIEHQWGGHLFTPQMFKVGIIGQCLAAIERSLPKHPLGRLVLRRFGANQVFVCRRS